MKAALIILLLLLCSSSFLYSQQFEPIEPSGTSTALEEAFLISKRREMVTFLIERHNLTDEALQEAFSVIPRHLFVPENLQRMAYRLSYLPLGGGQVLAEPSLLAAILSSLGIASSDKVLIAGASTPYTAALTSTLASQVYVIEGIPDQYTSGTAAFRDLGLTNISMKQAKTFSSWRDEAPFNCILIHGSIERIPSLILDMLAPDGRLVCSLADPSGFQMLLLVEKRREKLSIRSGGQSFFPFLDFL
jgi:protein-L-isoaspartate(D-aspartate) O-methyltransferase